MLVGLLADSFESHMREIVPKLEVASVWGDRLILDQLSGAPGIRSDAGRSVVDLFSCSVRVRFAGVTSVTQLV